MTTYNYLLSPTIQIEDSEGKPLVGGKVYIYEHDSQILATTYSNFEGSLNTNPVILDTLGHCTIIADEEKYYDIIVNDADDLLQFSAERVSCNTGTGTVVDPVQYEVVKGNGIIVNRSTLLDGTVRFTVSNNAVNPSVGTGSAIWVEGGNNTAGNGDYIHIEGSGNNTINGSESIHIEGSGNSAGNKYNHVEGGGNTVETSTLETTGGTNHVEGGGNTLIEGGTTHVEGGGNNVTGSTTHVEGGGNIVSGSTIHVEGYASNVSFSTNESTGSHIEGSFHTVSVSQSGTIGLHIEGSNNTVNSVTENTHIEGKNNTVSGLTIDTHIEGSDNTITDCSYSHVGGRNNTVEGEYNTVGGYGNIVNNDYNTAYGRNNTINGSYNTALGQNNRINEPTAQRNLFVGADNVGFYTLDSVVIGNANTLSNTGNSITIGSNNSNQTTNSIVAGVSNACSLANSGSIVVGNNLYTRFEKAVFGQYNVSNGTMFQVGCGTDEANRKNALEITDDGITSVKVNDKMESIPRYLVTNNYFPSYTGSETSHWRQPCGSIKNTLDGIWGPAGSASFGCLKIDNHYISDPGKYRFIGNVSIKGGTNFHDSPMIQHFDWFAVPAGSSVSEVDAKHVRFNYVSQFSQFNSNCILDIPEAGNYDLYCPIMTSNWELDNSSSNLWLVNITMER